MPPFDTRHLNVADPVNPPIVSCEGHRSAAGLDAVIDQFDVERNPRYKPRDTSGNGRIDTHCDAFVHDVTRAMHAEVPNWWRGRELSANGMCDWLATTGKHFGWDQVSAPEALAAANRGQPVVVAWKNPAGSGHVAMVRPNPGSLLLAQAGRQCLARATLAACFGRAAAEVRFYRHA